MDSALILNPQQGTLPVPAQTTFTFGGENLSDTSNDPYSINYPNLYTSFNVDPNNAANATVPTVIQDSVAAAGAA